VTAIRRLTGRAAIRRTRALLLSVRMMTGVVVIGNCQPWVAYINNTLIIYSYQLGGQLNIIVGVGVSL
jgi:hypothetical protein